MTKLIRFKKEHMMMLGQEALRPLAGFVTRKNLELMEQLPHSYTIQVNEKYVLCGGFVEYWAGRAEAWAVVNQDCKREFLAMHRQVVELMDMVPFKRIELAVEIDFKPGHRWAKKLGFDLEAQRLRRYMPTGGDVSLYARVK